MLTTAVVAQVGAPMQFMLVHADPSSGNYRPEGCVDWIAAEGMIDARSPGDLRKLLASIGNRKLPIIVNSPGGNVAAAMEMGEIIRKPGLSVAVGGTRLQSCPSSQPLCGDGWRAGANGVVYPAGTKCPSACPFVLAAGVRRVVRPFGIVGVHQVKTTYDQERIVYRMKYQTVNGKKRLISRQEISANLLGCTTAQNCRNRSDQNFSLISRKWASIGRYGAEYRSKFDTAHCAGRGDKDRFDDRSGLSR